MDRQDDIISGWVVALYKALLWQKIDPLPLLADLNICSEEINTVGNRVSLSVCNRLFEQAVDLTKDPLLPIKVSQCVVASTFHALGYSIQASASLKDAFARLVQYEKVISNVCSLTLTPDNDTYQLQLKLKSNPITPVVINPYLELTILLSIVKIGRDLAYPGLSPVKLYTTVPAQCAEQYCDYTGCSIEFQAKQPMLVMDAKQLEEKLPTCVPELMFLTDRVTDEYVAGLDSSSIVNQVRTEVIAMMATGSPSIDSVAERLNYSQRSLQRKLNDSGTSFKFVLEEIRQSMAEQYLNQSQLSLGEISYLLGFSNVANFSRAFKRWKGKSPGVYREGCIALKDNAVA